MGLEGGKLNDNKTLNLLQSWVQKWESTALASDSFNPCWPNYAEKTTISNNHKSLKGGEKREKEKEKKRRS